MANRPPRLDTLFTKHASALWFVTFNTQARAHLLDNKAVHERFKKFCKAALQHHTYVGKYVIMPDHVHLFVTGAQDFICRDGFVF